ncbi:MAG: RNA polymerase sigma factor [Planctomycetota bacterium]
MSERRDEDPRGLSTLLVAHEPALRGFLARNARGLLRFESLEDLVLGVQARALNQQSRFVDLGDPEFRAWLFVIARAHVADRHDHYSAAKRRASRLLRITFGSGVDDPEAVAPPATRGVGPSTVAERRELVRLIHLALAALPPRDQELVRMAGEGLSIAEQAARLGVSEAAAQRAGLRAFDRLRRTFELARRAATAGGDATGTDSGPAQRE